MVLLAFPKERCNSTNRKLMHERHAFLVMEPRCRILQSKGTHVEKVPCDIELLSKTKDTSKIPQLAALRVFDEKLSAFGDLTKSPLNTKLHHWQGSLPLGISFLLRNHARPFAPWSAEGCHENNCGFVLNQLFPGFLVSFLHVQVKTSSQVNRLSSLQAFVRTRGTRPG